MISFGDSIAEITCTTEQASRICKLTPRQLGYWEKQGIFTPRKKGNGAGSRREYDFDDLVQLRLLRKLKDNKISTQKLRKAVIELRKFLEGTDSDTATLVNWKNTVVAVIRTKKGERILLDILDPAKQQVMWIVIESLIEETKLLMTDLGIHTDVIKAVA